MKKKRLFALSGVLLLLAFVALILLLYTVDRQPIGPEGSVVGLAGINQKVFSALGESKAWYEITEIFGFVAILTAGGFALLALGQLIRRKSLWKIDKDLWIYALFLGVMAVLYVLFEKVIINYRPVLEEGQLAASFPSSHTMLVFCVMWGAMIQFLHRLPSKTVARSAAAVCALIIAVTVVGRLCSGVHWFTDILGGVLLAGGLSFIYTALLSSTCKKGKHDK